MALPTSPGARLRIPPSGPSLTLNPPLEVWADRPTHPEDPAGSSTRRRTSPCRRSRRNRSRSLSQSLCPAGKLPLTVDRLDHGPAANQADTDEQNVFPALTGWIALLLNQKTMQYHAGFSYILIWDDTTHFS